MRAGPALGAWTNPVHGQAGRGHAERSEQVALDRLLVTHAADPRDHLAGRIIGDILIAPAGARRADAVERRKRAAQEGDVLPLLQLVVEGVAIKPEPVAEHVADRRLQFVAARQMQRRRDRGDRLIEAQPALLGELGHHRRGDALRHGSPAEHGFRRNLLARTLERFAIAIEEGDPAVLDDADRHADHGRLFDHPLQALVEPGDSRSGCGSPARPVASRALILASLRLAPLPHAYFGVAEGLGKRERPDASAKAPRPSLN